jgi:hypothetical protein
MPLHLPDVTLCAVTAINHELTVRAMKECLKHCSFADVVLVSDRPLAAPFRVEIMPPFPDGSSYAPFICKNLTKYTPSSFNLLVQYDSYIIDPNAWDDRFLAYDYIGAKWPWHPPNRRVGNSGFCLRSKRFLDVIAEIPLPPPGQFLDDNYFCCTIRESLERDYKIDIAPEEVADKFAYERHVPGQPTFGFHGLFNFWRHMDDDEMEKIPYLIDNYYISTRSYLEVLLHYYMAGNVRVFGSWYARMRNHLGKEKTEQHLLSYVNEPPFIAKLMTTGEKELSVGGQTRA